jgi:hypothetical protein
MVLDMEIQDWVLIPLSGHGAYLSAPLLRLQAHALPATAGLPIPDPRTIQNGCVLLTFSLQFCPDLLPYWLDLSDLD